MTAIAMSGPSAVPTGEGDACIGRIPVRNLWLLMLYASDLFRGIGVDTVGVEDSPDDLPDLVAEILAKAVEHRLHRQLTYGYQPRHAVMNRVRGRIDLLTTERHQLLRRGLVACQFNELTNNTPRNRFVRTALEKIAKIVKRAALAHRCRSLANSLRSVGVIGDAPTRKEIGLEQFGRHDAHDRQMVDAAKLALDLVLPTETTGQNFLHLPDREIRWVRHLFERAIGGFYAVVLDRREWKVRGSTSLTWQVSHKTMGIDSILPSMKTDIVLDHVMSQKRLVIDTKFTSIVTKGWRRDEALRSGYIYQIYAYLRSQVGGDDVYADTANGLLLHPAIEEAVDEAVTIQGHTIRFATVDLSAPTNEIRAQLLRVIENPYTP